jgi:hypothetical protein
MKPVQGLSNALNKIVYRLHCNNYLDTMDEQVLKTIIKELNAIMFEVKKEFFKTNNCD